MNISECELCLDRIFDSVFGSGAEQSRCFDSDVVLYGFIKSTATETSATASTTESTTTAIETTSTTQVTTSEPEETVDTSSGEENTPISGDVNGHGEVNLKDAVLIRRYIAGGWNINIGENADINGDGEINLKDVILIRRYIVGGWK